MAGSRGSKISILLVSKTGNGKSSLANALLNTSEFQVGRGMLSSTAHCKCISTHARDRDLTVVDTPGTMDVEDEEKAKTEIRRAISFCPQGFDVFLVVVKCDARFTAEERRAIEVVAEMFGDVFYKHAIVVFSHGDEFDNDEAEFHTELQETRTKIPYLDQLLTRCGNRFVLVDNSRKREKAVQERQIEALLSLADGLVTSNGGRKYTSSELEAEKKKAEGAERRRAAEEEERRERERLEFDRQVNAQLTVRMEEQRQRQRETSTGVIDGNSTAARVMGSLLNMGASAVGSYLATRSASGQERPELEGPPMSSSLHAYSQQSPPLPWDSSRGPFPRPLTAVPSDLFRQTQPIFQISQAAIETSPTSAPSNDGQASRDRLLQLFDGSSSFPFGSTQDPVLTDSAGHAMSASRDLPSSTPSNDGQASRDRLL